MQIEVVLLSGTLKLSGSTTWLNGLVAGFEGLGIQHVHLVTGVAGELPSKAEQVFYTGRSRNSFYIKILRWLQLHKLCKTYFTQVEASFFSNKVRKLLQGKLAKKVLVIKDFTSYLPEYFIDSRFVVVDVLHQQFPEYQPASHHDYLIAVSQSVMDASRELGFVVDRTIYSPLDIDAIRQQSLRYVPDVGKPYLIFVGSLYQQKGIFELLAAFAQLKSNILSGYKLVYAGSGRDYEKLQLEAKRLGLGPDVLFTGMLVNPYPWIAGASMLILPSYSEAMAYVPLEAAVLGTPYLVADFTAAREFFCIDNIFCGNFEEVRIKNLKLAIERLIQQPKNDLLPRVAELMQPEVSASEYYKLLNGE